MHLDISGKLVSTIPRLETLPIHGLIGTVVHLNHRNIADKMLLIEPFPTI